VGKELVGGRIIGEKKNEMGKMGREGL